MVRLESPILYGLKLESVVSNCFLISMHGIASFVSVVHRFFFPLRHGEHLLTSGYVYLAA